MNQELTKVVNQLFESLKATMLPISDADFSQPLEVLSGSTIGQHTRHCIEFFQCLLEQSALGVVNYDKRQRNQMIQKNKAVAYSMMEEVVLQLSTYDTQDALLLETDYGFGCQRVSTTFERELVYNIEHTVHHLAMLRIALNHLNPQMEIAEGFGVANSTQRHKEDICAR